jgi:hypothetical protein
MSKGVIGVGKESDNMVLIASQQRSPVSIAHVPLCSYAFFESNPPLFSCAIGLVEKKKDNPLYATHEISLGTCSSFHS